ncbi:MAG: YceI family protein [Bacteroidales bacterium]
MRTLLIISIILGIFSTLVGQENYITRDGYIRFYSHTPIEDIKADNNHVGSIINPATGEIVFTLKMIDFNFEKKLMQRHFNDKFVESDKFPKSTFKGFITDNDKVDYSVAGTYPVVVEGELTIHGVTRTIRTSGIIEVISAGIKGMSGFIIRPADYDIKIPKIVRNKIAEEMEITVKMAYEPME